MGCPELGASYHLERANEEIEEWRKAAASFVEAYHASSQHWIDALELVKKLTAKES